MGASGQAHGQDSAVRALLRRHRRSRSVVSSLDRLRSRKSVLVYTSDIVRMYRNEFDVLGAVESGELRRADPEGILLYESSVQAFLERGYGA